MLAKNILGKPYAGKLHVRFDEGAGKSFTVLTALLYRNSAGNSLNLFRKFQIGFCLNKNFFIFALPQKHTPP
jgi:hypothetical protein